MPYGPFKKTFPADYSPPALMVYYFQEISGFRSGGYNLPNFDDIRRDVGAKNIIRLPMPGEDADPTLKAMRREALKEFLPAGKVEPVLANRERCCRNLVLMHEIIGHGSGTYDTSKYAKTDDPVSILGRLGSALEEQRADLTALVFVDDPKLVEIGACKDATEARLFRQLTYDMYLGDFLQRLSRDRTLAEMHQRGHWLFINKLLNAGAIRWVERNGGIRNGDYDPENQVLAVVDYDQFQNVARALLGELQAIKANREEKQLQGAVQRVCPAIGDRTALGAGNHPPGRSSGHQRGLRGTTLACNSRRQVRNSRRQYPGKHRTVLEALRSCSLLGRASIPVRVHRWPGDATPPM